MKIKRIIKPLAIIGAGFAVMAMFGGFGLVFAGKAYGAKGFFSWCSVQWCCRYCG